MAITRRPTGTLADIRQVDPGVYYDTSGGGYYTGTWDNPNYIGDTYANYGSDGRAQPAPIGPYGDDRRVDPQNAPSTQPYGGDTRTERVPAETPYTGDTRTQPTGVTSTYRPSSAPPPTAPSATTSGTYEQALQIANQYSQYYQGRPLTQAEISGYLAQYGGGPGTTVTGAGLLPVLERIAGVNDGRAQPVPTNTPPVNNTPPNPNQGRPAPTGPGTYYGDTYDNGVQVLPPATGIARRGTEPRIGDTTTTATTQTNPALTNQVNGMTGRQYMTQLLLSKYANDPDEAARQYNTLYGATTGNEAYYDRSRNVIVTPFSGYFANGPEGWKFAETHEGPGGGGGGGGNGPSNYNYQQALDVVQRAIGRSLTPAEIDEAFKKFGGTRNDTFTDSGLAPVIAYFKSRSGGPSPNPNPNPNPNIPTGTYGGPGNGGVFGTRDLQQVGQDPFSQLLTGGLAALIGSGGQGITGFGQGVRGSIYDMLANGGRFSPANEALNLETARGVADRTRRAETAGIQGQLASRGLLSEPGHIQGSEIGATNRLEENVIAPLFADAVQKYLIHEGDLASNRFTTAMTTGANLSNNDNTTLLDAIAGGTDRQHVLGDLAIRELEQNRLFNQFLATYGLDVDKFLNELQSGKNTALIALLQQFLNATGISTGGFI